MDAPPSLAVRELADLPLDCIELLCDALFRVPPTERVTSVTERVARGSHTERTAAIIAFSSTCTKLYRHLRADEHLWNRYALQEWTLARDVEHAGFRLRFSREHGFSFLPEFSRMGCDEDDEILEYLDGNFMWCARTYRERHTEPAAFARPTVGPGGEQLTVESGGYANFARLERASRSLTSHLHVRECDVANLGFAVDVIVVPSNEHMQDPGWGAIHALYAKGGEDLHGWVGQELAWRRTTGRQLVSGDVVVGPAFGDIDAKWLCHAVGIPWHGMVANKYHATTDGTRAGPDAAPDSAWQKSREEAAAAQVKMIAGVFRAAASVGATSIALPAISAGKRGFPGGLAASISCAAAAVEVLASGCTLDVYLVGFGDENQGKHFRTGAQLAACELISDPQAHRHYRLKDSAELPEAPKSGGAAPSVVSRDGGTASRDTAQQE